MNNPRTPEALDTQVDKIAAKKEYVKPTIDEGEGLPTATAVVFTPVAEN